MRRLLRLRSLKNKLALIFFGITALAMVAIWFYVVPQLQTSLYEQRRKDLTRVAIANVEPLRKAVGSGVHAKNLDELVRAVADSSDARVTVYGVQSSRSRSAPLWLVSDSAAQKEVDVTTALAEAAART
ncbi:MAG: hypothetical protein QOJ29_4850, partial [Thermoleophilaceae bacterium]|nr:hypothetical protein [Thermoleophilaceae bacterium]